MPNFDEYFPLGLATGEAFCDRVEVRKTILRNIEGCRHTILSSPRRYGKSSLAEEAMKESKLPFEKIDLFVAKDAKVIEHCIVKSVRKLISKVVSGPEQAFHLIKDSLKHLRPKIEMGTSGVNIEFELVSLDVATNILDLLSAFDLILKRKDTKAILFFDEFQQIGQLGKGMSIEGAIRHVAQETKNIVFIFSGSNRHLLMTMFDDSNRPLYKLCDQMDIERISAKDYVEFLNHVSNRAWNQNLNDSVFSKIFFVTERHPYYMNVLCSKLWESENIPTEQDVCAIWKKYVLNERSRTIVELDKLSSTQYHIITDIARGQLKDFTSREYLSKTGFLSSTVTNALLQLEKKDYIYKRGGECFIVDPLIKSSLQYFLNDEA